MADNTIDAYWDRDPHELTDEDYDHIISDMRERRQQFLAGNQRAGKIAKPPEGADPEKAKAALAGLGL